MAGRLYVTGGSNNESTDSGGDDDESAGLTDVDVFDVERGTTSHAAPMGLARYGHATAASTTSLFIFGVCNGAGVLSSSEEFNTQTMR